MYHAAGQMEYYEENANVIKMSAVVKVWRYLATSK